MTQKVRLLNTVLLAEDVDMLREMLRIFMESMGLQILEAATASEAIDIARTHPGQLDLLLLDVDSNGSLRRESVEELMRLRPDAACLYMSSEIALPAWNHPYESDRSAFIRKPFRLEELRLLLFHMLSDRESSVRNA
jgi:two-component system, cell cycle sensor histidine kinase and response regulator CckA